MRVLLVSANRLRPSPSVPWTPVEPLGAAYVASALARAGYETEILDLCFAESIVESVGAAIERFEPDFIGVSIRNIDLMAYFNPCSFSEEIAEILAACRLATSAAIILGGSGFSVMPRELLEMGGVEFGGLSVGHEDSKEWGRRHWVVRVRYADSSMYAASSP